MNCRQLSSVGVTVGLNTLKATPTHSRYRRLQIQFVGAEAQGRTGDTGIFSAVLYQLSYLSNGFSS